jgi:hypothetical protein
LSRCCRLSLILVPPQAVRDYDKRPGGPKTPTWDRLASSVPGSDAGITWPGARRIFEDWLARGIIAAHYDGYTVFSFTVHVSKGLDELNFGKPYASKDHDKLFAFKSGDDEDVREEKDDECKEKGVY